jgi:hypothetical protein
VIGVLFYFGWVSSAQCPLKFPFPDFFFPVSMHKEEIVEDCMGLTEGSSWKFEVCFLSTGLVGPFS